MEGEAEWDAVAEALNAANSNPRPTTKNAKLFHSLVAECQVGHRITFLADLPKKI